MSTKNSCKLKEGKTLAECLKEHDFSKRDCKIIDVFD